MLVMNMKGRCFFAMALLFVLSACKTEDVTPIIKPDLGSLVSLSVNKTNILESSDSALLTATLSKVASADVTVKLTYLGKATFDVDYNASIAIVIAAGSLSNTTNILAIQDTLKEGIEDIIIAIDSVIGGGEEGVQMLSLNIEDDDVPASFNLILNEILYDPSNVGIEGDANGDGVYAQNEDEFIELVNNSSDPIDVSGFKVFDAAALAANIPRHVIPNGTIIQAQKALVIFGGGTPTGTFGNATVQKSTSGDLNLNNAGDILTITDAANNVILTFDITPLSDNPNESYTRNPDLTGIFEQHTSSTAFKFSPGTKINAAPF